MHLLLTMVLAASWVEVRSDSMVLRTAADPVEAVALLEEAEHFFASVGSRVFPDLRPPALPLEILILDRAEMEGLEPESGRVAVTGYYQIGLDRDFIVLAADLDREAATRSLRHELTHYMVTHAMVRPAIWLSEGLASYFGAAEFERAALRVGQALEDRIEILSEQPMLPLEELFLVGPGSPEYHDLDRANVLYSQSWALVHFLMHGRYAGAFEDYLAAMRSREADLMEFIPVSAESLELELAAYLRSPIVERAGARLEALPGRVERRAEPISRGRLDASLAELLIVSGRSDAAGPYLDAAFADTGARARVAYWKGMLAARDAAPGARDHFIDALADPRIAPLAAIRLVELGEWDVPEAFAVLEEEAAAGTRVARVYWALADIHLAERRRIENLARIAASRPPPLPPPPPPPSPAPEVVVDIESEYGRYGSGEDGPIAYELWTTTDERPQVRSAPRPYYPDDLRRAAVGGEVELDVQLSSEGDVLGLWLISARPEVLGTLATSAVRQWRFEAIPAKIRVILRFNPE